MNEIQARDVAKRIVLLSNCLQADAISNQTILFQDSIISEIKSKNNLLLSNLDDLKTMNSMCNQLNKTYQSDLKISQKKEKKYYRQRNALLYTLPVFIITSVIFAIF